MKTYITGRAGYSKKGKHTVLKAISVSSPLEKGAGGVDLHTWIPSIVPIQRHLTQIGFPDNLKLPELLIILLLPFKIAYKIFYLLLLIQDQAYVDSKYYHDNNKERLAQLCYPEIK